jgi:hypothetical protein
MSKTAHRPLRDPHIALLLFPPQTRPKVSNGEVYHRDYNCFTRRGQNPKDKSWIKHRPQKYEDSEIRATYCNIDILHNVRQFWMITQGIITTRFKLK